MDKVTYALAKKLLDDASVVDVAEVKRDLDDMKETIESLGDLSAKDSASGTYTPAGTVTQPTFSGTEGNVSVKGTPAGTVSQPTFSGTQATIKSNVTAAGTVSKPAINVSAPTTVVNSITNVGTLPTLQTSVENEVLEIVFTPGTLPTKGSNTAVVTGVTAALAANPTFTGTQVEGTATYTPEGTVSQPTFTGSETTSTGTFTPAGTVSQPTFSGTQATIEVS